MTVHETLAAESGRDESANKSFLLTLGDRLLREWDTEAILALTCEHLAQELGVSRVAFCELAQGIEVGLITTREWAKGVPSFAASPQRWRDLNPALTDRLEAGQILAIEDMEREPDLGSHPNCVAREFSDHALVAVPLIRAERLVAYLLVANKHPRFWLEPELDLIREVAVRTWETLERARAEAKLREREATQAFLLQLADATRDEADPEQILDQTARRLQRHLRVSRIGYWEVDGATGDFLPPRQWVDGVAPAQASFDSKAIDSLTKGITLHVGNVAEEEGLENREELISSGTSAYLCVPLVKAGRYVAALAITHHEPRVWSDSEVLLVEEIAERTWATLQRARAEAALERSREALFQSEKLTALGALLAGVSHELNNPLSVVVGQALMLEQRASDPETARRAGKIRNSAERCARIVRTFLAMARQRPPERRLADINELIRSAAEITAYGCRASGIRVRMDLSDDLPALHVDPDQLHQVFTNLLINAQHALEEHEGAREVQIATSLLDGGGGVRVTVSDSGPGIAPEIRHRIFEPFFTTKAVGSGTGLGLSFAHGVIETHGGTLRLLPASRGANFEISLPLPAEMKPAIGAGAGEAAGRSRGVALLIDDEVELAETLGDFLEADGWQTVLEYSGQGALDRLRAGDFDLIISDVRMPDVGGPELHAWIAEHRPHLLSRLAFLTGDTLGAAASSFLKRARRPFAEKPFSPDTIAQLVAEVNATRGNN